MQGDTARDRGGDRGQDGGIEIRGLAPGDADWLVAQHRRLYASDEGFDESFPALVGQVLAEFERDFDPTRERAFIAWQDGQRLGSIFCAAGPDHETAKLRLFLLLPEARGKGLGKRLLAECTGFARASGHRRMVLWTHESHRAACALYAATGWRLVRSEPKVSFGCAVVEQGWELDL